MIAPEHPTPAQRRAETLAALIFDELQGTGPGHCVRVNYLQAEEAHGVCRRLQELAEGSSSDVAVSVLASVPSAESTDVEITADRAIELRNRKSGRLCLFVPADLVDATASSLGNSFAEIDGRDLYRRAVRKLSASLDLEARFAIQTIQGELTGTTWVSDHDRLDIALAAADLEERDEIEQLGLELWRVGLIADARPDFTAHLRDNRGWTRELARPRRVSASYRERIARLGVSDTTARQLELFFAKRALHDVRSWSRALIDGNLTLDRWEFTDAGVESDLESVQIRPFTDTQGAVLKMTRLQQKDGPGGALFAQCGPDKSIALTWETVPRRPDNVAMWRVELVPSELDPSSDELSLLDLPGREVKGDKRRAEVRLDLESDVLDDLPQTSFRLRVTAASESGAEIHRNGKPVLALSDEFYLVRGAEDAEAKTATRRRTVGTLAQGRLEVAIEPNISEVVLDTPTWVAGRGITYFSIKAQPRTMLNLALAPLLLNLERQTLADPRSGGRWILPVDEVAPSVVEEIQEAPPIEHEGAAWTEFWRARRIFFERVRQAAPQDVVEVAEWTTEQLNAAVRYAQAYSALLDTATIDALQDALSVDTLVVTIDRGVEDPEISAVVLPTHPLRAAWFAVHASLLRSWEQSLVALDHGRTHALDPGLLRELVPSNTPPFVHVSTVEEPLVFFQNLGVYHGVALPAAVPDPTRRYLDVAEIVGFGDLGREADDRHPEQLGRQLRRYRDTHPYADPILLALLNPDQGEFIAAALDEMMKSDLHSGDDEAIPTVPVIDITAYVVDDQLTSLSALDRFRSREIERHTTVDTDAVLPALSTTLRSYQELRDRDIQPSHVAIAADLTRPRVVTVAGDIGAVPNTVASLALYGLIVRFSGELLPRGDGLAWRYRVIPDAVSRPDAHPAGPRFGEVLIETHAALLRAAGRSLRPSPGTAVVPAVEVAVDIASQTLLEQLHRRADWVVTIDRLFGVDYYDSPGATELGDIATKYLIDYAPEFSEGMGHRTIVTTTWRGEVALLLRRAMDELGFATVDRSVRALLNYLRIASGRLALQAATSTTTGAAAVSVAAVVAWLKSHGRLAQAVLVPIDPHQHLFARSARGAIPPGERRCDLILFGLRRGIVDTTFIEVKWRRGSSDPLGAVAEDVRAQMQMTAKAVEDRFFNAQRVDGALQRTNLANLLRFYSARAIRYDLLDPAAAAAFLSHLSQLEKSGLDFRPSFEGFIVSLDRDPIPPYVDRDLTIRVLTAQDFEEIDADLVMPGVTECTPDGADPSCAVPSTDSVQDEREATPESTDVAIGMDVSPASGPFESATPHGATARTPASETTSGVEIVLGTTTSGPVVWRPSVTGSPHLFITGIPGQGKSWTVMRILTELERQGIPSLVFDFHGQLGEYDSLFVRNTSPIILNAAHSLPFSPFECNEESLATNWRATALSIAEIFGYVCRLGEIQQDALYQAIRDAYLSQGFGSGGRDPNVGYPTLSDVLRRIEQSERQGRTQNLAARLRPLLEMDIFRPEAAQGPALIDALHRGLVVDLHELPSETLQLTAGAFLLRKVYREMFQWGMASHLRLVIVLDEAHRLARDVTLPKIMKEGRKFGVAVVVASQGLADFHADVLNTAGTKIAYRANHAESRKIAGFFHTTAGRDLSAVLEGLNVGTALVQTPDMPSALRVSMSRLDDRSTAHPR